MEDRTVILTSVNEVWTRPNSLLDIFLDSFKNGEDTAHLLDHASSSSPWIPEVSKGAGPFTLPAATYSS
jgi:hypothetical protein